MWQKLNPLPNALAWHSLNVISVCLVFTAMKRRKPPLYGASVTADPQAGNVISTSPLLADTEK
jgi:hypothetical protein